MNARGKSVLFGVATLALGVPAWLWGTARRPGREAHVSTSRLSPDSDLARDLLVPRTPEREALSPVDASTPRGSDLRVDVLDANGHPAAWVPVLCGIVASPGSFHERLRTSSDARGSARIELSELSQASLRSSESPGESLSLRAGILARPLPEVVIDREALEAKQIVLQLPPTGSVRLEVADPLGRAMPPAARFAVWARGDGARDVDSLPRWIEAPAGVAILEHVGLGLELRVAVAMDGDGARVERVSASGPRVQGEERTISVPLGAEWPTGLVRVRNEHGQLLRNEVLGVAVEWTRPGASSTWSPGATAPRPCRTDDEGRARFPLRGSVAGGYTRRVVLTYPFERNEANGGLACSAERDVSWDVAAGSELDLGEVELRPAPKPASAIWISGIVTDHDGKPVRAATVLVSAIDPEGTPVAGAAAQLSVEPDGRFVVTGPPIEQRISVRAVAPGFLDSTPEVVLPGASGLGVRLRAAARWEGRIRLDPGIAPASLVVELITQGDRRRTLLTSEHVAIGGLDAAWVDVEVRTRMGDWLVARWERLATLPSGTPSAARIAELDLRGELTRVRVHLTEPDGTILDHVFAHVQPEPWPDAGSWIRAGRLDLVVPGEARRILIRPRGHSAVVAESTELVQELTCSPDFSP